MKKTITVLLVLCLCLLPVLTCGATSVYDDINYSGVLGSFYDDGTGESSVANTRITISDTCSYDSSKRLYYYSTNLGYITSDTFDGMMTTGSVKILAPEELTVTLFCDGQAVETDLTDIKEPGRYSLRYSDNNGMDATVLSFTIVAPVTCSAGAYTLPAGFAVDTLTKDGEQIPAPAAYVPFEEDGIYRVEYHCTATGIRYTLNITVDTVPPEITLSGLKNGSAWGPVTVSDIEKNGTVLVFRDGQAEDFTEKLTKSGRYELVAVDEAGNKTSYSFTIMIYLNAGSFIFFLVLVLIAAGVGAYIILSRKKLRIR